MPEVLRDGELVDALLAVGVGDLRRVVGGLVAYSWIRARALAAPGPRSGTISCSGEQATVGIGRILGWADVEAEELRSRHHQTVRRWLGDLQQAGLIAVVVACDQDGRPRRTDITLRAPQRPTDHLVGDAWLTGRLRRALARRPAGQPPTRSVRELQALEAWRDAARERGCRRARERRARLTPKCPTPAGAPLGGDGNLPHQPLSSPRTSVEDARAPRANQTTPPGQQHRDRTADIERRVAAEQQRSRELARVLTARTEQVLQELRCAEDLAAWTAGRRTALAQAFALERHGCADPALAGYMPADSWTRLRASLHAYQQLRPVLGAQAPTGGVLLLDLARAGRCRTLHAAGLLLAARLKGLRRIAPVLGQRPDALIAQLAADVLVRRPRPTTTGRIRFRTTTTPPGAVADFGPVPYTPQGLPAITWPTRAGQEPRLPYAPGTPGLRGTHAPPALLHDALVLHAHHGDARARQALLTVHPVLLQARRELQTLTDPQAWLAGKPAPRKPSTDAHRPRTVHSTCPRSPRRASPAARSWRSSPR